MLTRFDPFKDIDRLFDSVSPVRTDVNRGMPIDIARGTDHYLIQADLPGVRPESIDISVEGNVLTLAADRAGARVDDLQLLSRERPTGRYVRRLTVGEGFDLDQVKASYSDGVLTVMLPVAEKAKPRRIEVAVEANTSPPIETTTAN
jgi:HSP20 family protein